MNKIKQLFVRLVPSLSLIVLLILFTIYLYAQSHIGAAPKHESMFDIKTDGIPSKSNAGLIVDLFMATASEDEQ